MTHQHGGVGPRWPILHDQWQITQTLRCFTVDGADATTLDGGARAGDVKSPFYTATPSEIRFYAPIGAVVDSGTGNCGTELVVLQKQ